jgi:hypothetical protein
MAKHFDGSEITYNEIQHAEHTILFEKVVCDTMIETLNFMLAKSPNFINPNELNDACIAIRQAVEDLLYDSMKDAKNILAEVNGEEAKEYVNDNRSHGV